MRSGAVLPAVVRDAALMVALCETRHHPTCHLCHTSLRAVRVWGEAGDVVSPPCPSMCTSSKPTRAEADHTAPARCLCARPCISRPPVPPPMCLPRSVSADMAVVDALAGIVDSRVPGESCLGLAWSTGLAWLGLAAGAWVA